MARQMNPAVGRGVFFLLVVGIAAGVYFKWFNDPDAPDAAPGAVATATEDKTVEIGGQKVNGGVVYEPKGTPVAAVQGNPQVASTGNTASNGLCGTAGLRPCRVALSQWPGHMAGILACGGLTTQPGSFCSQVLSTLDPTSGSGLNVEFSFIETPDGKNSALQKGEVDFVWQTTDELPINYQGFARAGINAQSFVQIDSSTGGDGCVGTSKIKSPRDLLNYDWSVMAFSPDHTVAEFYINNGDLTPGEVNRVRARGKFSPDDWTYARTLYCQGTVEFACLWEPDLQQALACRKDEGSHIVFSTGDAKTLVADNLLALTTTLAKYPGVAEKMARIYLEGAKSGKANPQAAARLISTVVPRFQAEIKYEGTLKSFTWVKWNDLADNVRYFGIDGTSPLFDVIYKQADLIWGEYIDKDGNPVVSQRFPPHTLRNGTIIKAIYEQEVLARAAKAATMGVAPAPIEQEKVVYAAPQVIAKAEPVMVKPVTINFETGLSDLDTGAVAILKRDVLPALKQTEGMGVRIEGNTDKVGQPAKNKVLSQKRADSVKAFFVQQGVDPSRLVPLGNGQDNPLCNSSTPECLASNRRTDIIFVRGQAQ